jgi:hypothetical protein
MGIIIEGELVAIANQDATIPDDFIVPAKKFDGISVDYSQDNATALSKRKHRLDGFNPVNGRIKGDKDYLFGQLEAELLQIRDLTSAIRKGQNHHTFGLSSRLRLLISAGKTPMPLLQLSAATIGEPLIIYVLPKPLHVPITDLLGPAAYGLSCDMSPTPTSRLVNPIDLDIWLEQPALTMKTAKVSHRKVLTVIGDTIGSHVDQYIHPYVHALLSMKTGIATDQGNQLIHYLLKVSDSALALCQRLLEKR